MLSKLRFIIAFYAAKLSYHVLTLIGRQAYHYPGRLARQIDPDFLKHLQKPEHIINVTGSNGKTTVSNYLADFLEALGETVAINRTGGNFQGGIITALIRGTTLSLKPKGRFAVLETDELIFADLKGFLVPEVAVVTNLSRDHYERVGTTEYLFDSLNDSLSTAGLLILNGDDMISGRLVPDAPHRFYRVSWQAHSANAEPLASDLVLCPLCDHKLAFLHRQFNHIGSLKCPHCGFKNPAADLDIIAVNQQDQTFTVRESGEQFTYHYPLESVVDAYNIAASLTALRALGFDHDRLQTAIAHVKRSQIRYESFVVGKKHVIKLFAKTKSPMGTSRSFEMVAAHPGTKSLLLLPEDFEPADVRDSVSWLGWLYDTDFELLNDPSIKQIVVGGWQADDYRVRLNLAGIPDERVLTVTNAQLTAANDVDLAATDTFFVLYQNFFKTGEMNVNAILETLLSRMERTTGATRRQTEVTDGKP